MMKPIFWTLLANATLASFCTPAPTISKVEPPNWWANYSVNPVRPLISGSELAGASVQAPIGFAVSNVRVSANGAYLFCDLQIPADVAPGDYPLKIQTGAGSSSASFRIETALPDQGRFAGFSSDDVVYLIMVDRFADGDSSNDNPGAAPHLFDRSNPRAYHGGDFQGIIDHLPYLKSLGVTAIWITPIYDNSDQPGESKGQMTTDYHGYGTIDYYAVENHFGTVSTLRKLIDAAHANGIKVIQDQVANHAGPRHPWVNNPPEPDWFHGTANHHINETWQVWGIPDPHASPELKRDVLDGWFADVLPDMNQENADVANYEIQNALWWIQTAGFDAIRQDTLPYVPRLFWTKWASALKHQFPDIRVVGEVFDANPAVPSFFQGGVKQWDGIDSGIDTVFDFPGMFAARDVFAAGKPMDTLSKVLAEDRLYANPNILVPFIGNHDLTRFMSLPGVNARQLKLAFTYLLTTRGTPEIYYGDEIGMRGGEDPDNRHDFPGGWTGDPHNAFEPSGRTPEEADIFNYARQLIGIRKKLEPLRRGSFVDLGVTDATWVYARKTSSQTVIVAFNNGAIDSDIAIASLADGVYKGALGNVQSLVVKDGTGHVHIPAHTSEIFAK